MVYTTHLCWLGGWFIIAIPTLHHISIITFKGFNQFETSHHSFVWLVVWNIFPYSGTFFHFSVGLEQFSVFFRGAGSTTNQHWELKIPWKTLISLWFSYGYPMVFLWFSSGFPLVFLWISYGYPKVFLWFSFGFPLVWMHIFPKPGCEKTPSAQDAASLRGHASLEAVQRSEAQGTGGSRGPWLPCWAMWGYVGLFNLGKLYNDLTMTSP